MATTSPPSDGPETILRVDDLKVWFPRRANLLDRQHVKAVDGVSFTLRRGETLGIVGESGSGKTTTARAVLRLLTPTAGRIEFLGVDLASMRPERLRRMRREMQAVFQDPYSSLNPRRRVGEIIAEPLVVHGMGARKEVRDRVAELLETVGLEPGQARRYPHEFSGGQRQRIAIARALAVRPSLIVCDEAVSALDVSVQAQIINLLKALQDEFGVALLFISHDLGVIRSIAHDVAVMYMGRVVEMAGSDDVYRDPKHPYTSVLLSSVPMARPSIERARPHLTVTGSAPNPASPPPGCHFHPRCPEVMEACSTVDPARQPVGRQHDVACHLYGIESVEDRRQPDRRRALPVGPQARSGHLGTSPGGGEDS